MSDNNGWPGKPGVPLNPDQEGWHWVQRVDKGFVPNPRVILWTDDWTSGQFSWDAIGYSSAPEQKLGRDFRYLGPAITPAEVDARVKEAVDLGIDIATRELAPQIAMLIPWQTAIEDALSNWCDAVADDETPKDALLHLIQIEMDAALDPKVSQAAADLVAKAKREAQAEERAALGEKE